MPLPPLRPSLESTFTILATLARLTFTFTCTPTLAHTHPCTLNYTHTWRLNQSSTWLKCLLTLRPPPRLPFHLLSVHPQSPPACSMSPLPLAITSSTCLCLVTVSACASLSFFLLPCSVLGLSLLRICFPRPFAAVFLCALSWRVSVCVCVLFLHFLCPFSPFAIVWRLSLTHFICAHAS